MLLACFLWTDALAASDKNKDAARERQAVRRVQQQLNETQQQKLALEQEKKTLEEELKKNHVEVESQKQSAVRAATRASQYEKDIAAMNKEKTDLLAQLGEAGKQNRKLEHDLKQTMAALIKQTEQRELCETKNGEIYRIGIELVGWYNRKGALNAILEAEPFTRMKSIEMENLLEDYRDKLESQRLQQSPR